MVEVPSIVIFIVCLIGCGYQSYFLGRRVGMTQCLEYLEDKRRESLVEESVIVEEWDRIFESGGKCPECTKYQCVCVEDDIKDEQ